MINIQLPNFIIIMYTSCFIMTGIFLKAFFDLFFCQAICLFYLYSTSTIHMYSFVSIFNVINF